MASWAQDHGFLRFYSIVGNVMLLLLAPCAGPSSARCLSSCCWPRLAGRGANAGRGGETGCRASYRRVGSASITDRKPAASDEGTRRASQPGMPGIAKGAARPPWHAPAERQVGKTPMPTKGGTAPSAPFNPFEKHPRGQRRAALNAQRQATRAAPVRYGAALSVRSRIKCF